MTLLDRMRQAAAIVRRRTPLILQTEMAECGLACLAMIAGRYGHRVDLRALLGFQLVLDEVVVSNDRDL